MPNHRKPKKKHQPTQEAESDMALTAEIANRVFNWQRLENRCLTTISAYLKMAEQMPNAIIVDKDTDNPYIFIDNGGSVLGVAHLDTISSSQHFAPLNVLGDWWVLSAQLDDRLGVFLLLDVLRYLGLTYDILLTTGEERGSSSAKKFVAPEGKSWNWMFECDRMDTDIVHYQYDDKAWLAAWRAAGFNRISHGSYTDIRDLENLGICGMNIGVGYTDYHSVWAKANMSDCARQVVKFCAFYHANKDIRYTHEPSKVRSYQYPAGRNVAGYDGSEWMGKRTTLPLLQDRTFSEGELVRIRGTDTIVEITSNWPHISNWGSVRTRRWHTRQRSPQGVMAYVNYDEDALEKIVLLPADTNVDSVTPMKGLPTSETILLGAEANHDLTLHLRRLCEGRGRKLKTQKARHQYERWLYGDDVFLNSGNKASNLQPYLLGDRVLTPGGSGVIDCYSPLIVKALDYQYWVRMDKADEHGWRCHLYFEAEISPLLDESRRPLVDTHTISYLRGDDESVDDVIEEVQAIVNQEKTGTSHG